MTTYADPISARVTGEWLPDGTSYPARVAGKWNGWAVPIFDGETARRVVADQQEAEKQFDGMDSLRFTDGGNIEFRSYNDEPGDEPEIIHPREDGSFCLGLGWTWELVDDDEFEDPDLPSTGQLDAFNRVKGSLSMGSWNRTVLPDGSHEFPVHADLGEKTSDGTTLLTTVAYVRIYRDGRVEVEAGDRS